MRIQQFTVDRGTAPGDGLASLQSLDPQLVLCFGHRDELTRSRLAAALTTALPRAAVLGCSSAANIGTAGLDRERCIVTGVRFERSEVTLASTPVTDMEDSEQAGERVGRELTAKRPRAVFVLGPGVDFNGSALIRGMRRALGPDVAIVGGLANDGLHFREPLLVAGATTTARTVVGVGISGEQLRVTHGSFGGWRPFGPVRRVTRAQDNVLFELDGEKALDVYRRYLGPEAANLPGSALLFPFSMLDSAVRETGVTRTILGLDEATGSITLAGEILQNGYLRLMCASQEDLINGAEMAAECVQAGVDASAATDSLGLLVSCIGRMSALGQRVEEEVDAVASVLGPRCTLTGFYSNGEICSSAAASDDQLHNQTMTVTRFSEAA